MDRIHPLPTESSEGPAGELPGLDAPKPRRRKATPPLPSPPSSLPASSPASSPALSPASSPLRRRKGRGAVSNDSGRFEPEARTEFDDGWGSLEEASAATVRTSVAVDRARTVIARNMSPDLGFDRSINPYRGCEHGCVYCYARPSHAFLGLSPGLDFETRLFAKPDAPTLLARELRRSGYVCRPIAMGTNTDPYQPIERRLKLTRRILEVLRDFRHPVSIVTKSAGVVRDIDILAEMAAEGLAKVAVSVTTLDTTLARTLEPRAATPGRRLGALRSLAEAGIPTVVMAAPLIPVLTDPELEAILQAAAEAGVGAANYIMLRLPLETRHLFDEWLRTHAPNKRDHVLNQVREVRGGRLNDPAFFSRQTGEGPYAELIHRRFVVATRKLGLRRDLPTLDTGKFKPPPETGEQLSLF